MSVTVSNVTTAGAPPMAPSPTQQAVIDANRIAYGKDALGRTLGAVRFSGKLRRRVLVAMSVENGQKPDLYWQALAACSCVSIDGDTIPFPTTEAQVFALMDRLEDEGVAALVKIQADNFIPANGDTVKN